MKLLVIPNLGKPLTRKCVSALGGLCARLPFELLMESAFEGVFPDVAARFGAFADMLRACDCVVVIGGDGTILHAAKSTINEPRPIVGINTGRLGFLASIEPDEIEKLERLLGNEYGIERRMLLEVELENGGETRRFFALNECAVTRGAGTRVIDAQIACDDRPIGTWTADGVVFATPSGSTAYALSAGGPIVDPALFAIEVAPICAHSLFSRPMMFAADKTLSVTVPQLDPARTAYLNVDGEDTVELAPGARVTISAARRCVQLVNLTGRTFSEIVNRKIIAKGF